MQKFDDVPEQIGTIREAQTSRLCREAPNQRNSGLNRVIWIGAETRMIDLEHLGLSGMKLEVPAFIQARVALDVSAGFNGDPSDQKIKRNIAAIAIENRA